MPRFCVQVREVYRQEYFVDADNEEEAVRAVKYFGGAKCTMGDQHYERTLDDDTWIVHETGE